MQWQSTGCAHLPGLSGQRWQESGRQRRRDSSLLASSPAEHRLPHSLSPYNLHLSLHLLPQQEIQLMGINNKMYSTCIHVHVHVHVYIMIYMYMAPTYTVLPYNILYTVNVHIHCTCIGFYSSLLKSNTYTCTCTCTCTCCKYTHVQCHVRAVYTCMYM